MLNGELINPLDRTESLLGEIRGRLLLCMSLNDSGMCLPDIAVWNFKLNEIARSSTDTRIVDSIERLCLSLGTLVEPDPSAQRSCMSIVLDELSELESVLIGFREELLGRTELNVGEFVDESFGHISRDHAPSPQSVIDTDADFDAELLEIFSTEAEELLGNMTANLDCLRTDPSNREALWEIRRHAHTFKGSAGIVGLEQPSRLAHRIEDLLDRFNEKEHGADPVLLDIIVEAVDTLRSLTLLVGTPVDESSIIRLHAAFDEAQIAINSPAVRGESVATESSTDPIELDVHGGAERTESYVSHKMPILRVPLARLDDLSTAMHELLVGSSAIERRMNELRRQIDELTIANLRLRSASSKIESSYEAEMLGTARNGFRHHFAPSERSDEFDSLEFDHYTEFHQNTRSLAETAADTFSINSDMERVSAGLEQLLDRQRRTIQSLKDGLVRIRMVEFGTLKTRLQRTARVTAEEEDRWVDLEMENQTTEVDTQLLDSLTEPLLHLIRNAVVHGIEPPETRRLLGKPENGKISVKMESDVAHAIVTVTDDGSGISVGALCQRAREMGMANVPSSDDAAMQLIFVPGLTTAADLSLRAGRGVGMSIVKQSVESAGGTISVESRPHVGTRFCIRLPLRLAVIKAVVVRAGTYVFALPADKITRIAYSSLDSLVLADNTSVTADLSDQFAGSGVPKDIDPVVIYSVGAHGPIAAKVSQVLRIEELALKPLGYPLSKIRGVVGAAITGNEEVLPLLDLEQLIGDATTPVNLAAVRSESSREALTVLVVDDSPSVRHSTTKTLESAGWLVRAARDGIEALEILRSSDDLPAIVLSDIEMPRMDGFELIGTMRSDAALHELPVIVITSRSGEKHRETAAKLGIEAFLSKPFNERELIAAVESYTCSVPAGR